MASEVNTSTEHLLPYGSNNEGFWYGACGCKEDSVMKFARLSQAAGGKRQSVRKLRYLRAQSTSLHVLRPAARGQPEFKTHATWAENSKRQYHNLSSPGCPAGCSPALQPDYDMQLCATTCKDM